jgi:ketopantoate hydroxymethyltransferase
VDVAQVLKRIDGVGVALKRSRLRAHVGLAPSNRQRFGGVAAAATTTQESDEMECKTQISMHRRPSVEDRRTGVQQHD